MGSMTAETTAVYYRLDVEVRERIRDGAAHRGMSMSAFVNQLLHEALDALDPNPRPRLTRLSDDVQPDDG